MVWPTDVDPRLSEYAVTDYTEIKALTKLDHLISLDTKNPTACTRLTGIMATIGPTSKDPDILEQMMAAGMNMARLNCAFEKRAWRSEVVRMLRQAAARYGCRMGRVYPLAIALDLRGPVARTGLIDSNLGGRVELKNGSVIQLTTDKAYFYTGTASIIYVNFPRINEMVRKDDVIFLDKRQLRFRVEKVLKRMVTCIVEAGGMLVSHRDISFEDAYIRLPTFSLHDEQDIEFAIEHHVDIIIASFVDNVSTMERLRELLGDRGKKIAIVCKVQNATALNNLDDLLKISDSIILSRHELAQETDPAKLVIVQKHVAARAMAMGKPCGVLAQVLQSMAHAHVPLRAELLDAGTCVLDGADYLILTTETSCGPNPVGAVAALAGALREAESCLWFRQLFIDLVDQVPTSCSSSEATALAAALAAYKTGAAFVAVVSGDGQPAQLVARYRPRCPVLAVTRRGRVGRQLHLCRGVVPLIYEEDPDEDWKKDTGKRINFCLQFGFDRGFLKAGDPVVVVSGWQQGSAPDSMRVMYAREMEPTEYLHQTA